MSIQYKYRQATFILIQGFYESKFFMKKNIIRKLILFGLTALILTSVFIACSKNNDDSGGTGGTGTTNSVSIKNFAFSVTSLTVSKGVSVTWTNNDAVAHTVTADDGTFDSGNITPNGTYSKTFTTAGTFAYHCSIHTNMKAKVVVQ